ncbi:MAG: hypothetical protein K0R43_448 [Pseudoduganella sp.]|jgi:hypothetical protein|nr:hypothetical protein [Pseudoduganella sp.]
MKWIPTLRLALWAFVLLQAAYFLLAWLVPQGLMLGDVRMVLSPKWLTPTDVAALAAAPKAVGMLASLPVLLLTGYAAWRLNALLRSLRAGDYFAVATIGHLRAFAMAALAAMAWSILDTLLRGLAWRHGFGIDGFVQVGVSSEELLAMFVCALFFLIAGLMQEGRRLAEENEGFI